MHEKDRRPFASAGWIGYTDHLRLHLLSSASDRTSVQSITGKV